MITFFTIIIVMNLIAWIYAKKELKKVTEELDQSKDILKTIYEDRWSFIKRTKETYGKTDSQSEKDVKRKTTGIRKETS